MANSPMKCQKNIEIMLSKKSCRVNTIVISQLYMWMSEESMRAYVQCVYY